MDATPRLHRPRRPPVGTETAPLPHLQPRRATRPDGPTDPAPSRQPITLGRARGPGHRPAPSSRRTWLTVPTHPYSESATVREWSPAPSEATPAELSRPDATIRPAQPASRRNHDQQAPDERSRLVPSPAGANCDG